MQLYKVLVIEDDPTARTKMGQIINKEGFATVLAANGAEGLEIFKKEKPDIVITDLKMPEPDGMEVMHTVKRMCPSTQVILVTGFGDYDTVVNALRQGAIDYLKKPIDLNQLSLALSRAKAKCYEVGHTAFFPTILLMEDEEPTRKKLARVLEKEKYIVHQASDGVEGVEVFQKYKVDLALMDIKMPRKNGLEALHEMRGISTDFSAIIFSGYGDEDMAVQAMRDGAVNFLRKPIDLDQLTVCIDKALEKLQAERALKCRLRELELMREIIVKISSTQEIAVDIRDHTRGPARNFASRLLDSLPAHLLVLDKGMNILYANEVTRKALETVPQKVDDEVLKKLGSSRSDGSLELLEGIKKMFENKSNDLQGINFEKDFHVTTTKMSLVGEEVTQEALLVVFKKD